MMHHRHRDRFMGMRSMSRDESMVEYMLKMLMQVLINFSMGLIMALVVSSVSFRCRLIYFFGRRAFVRPYIHLLCCSLILTMKIMDERDDVFIHNCGCAPQIFIFGLWGIIRTYQPNPLTGLFFFVTASCAAFAFVSSYLMVLFGAAGGGLYGMAKLAESNMRIAGGGRGQGQRRDIHGGRIDRTGGGVQ